jgi:hypothetical protein
MTKFHGEKAGRLRGIEGMKGIVVGLKGSSVKLDRSFAGEVVDEFFGDNRDESS